MHAITPQIIPTVINPAIPSALIKTPYQKHNPAKGEELDEFINGTDDQDEEDDRDEDYEQTETTINQPKTKINHPKVKFPDDDSNTGDNPIYPDNDEVVAEDGDDEEDDDDEIVTSIGY